MGCRNRNYVTHDFYCINCGQKGIPLARQQSYQHGGHHRKLMYCYHCKHTVNHIECRTEDERQDFLSQYLVGAFKEEAKIELEYERTHPQLHTYL